MRSTLDLATLAPGVGMEGREWETRGTVLHSHTLASLPPRRPKVRGYSGEGRPPASRDSQGARGEGVTWEQRSRPSQCRLLPASAPACARLSLGRGRAHSLPRLPWDSGCDSHRPLRASLQLHTREAKQQAILGGSSGDSSSPCGCLGRPQRPSGVQGGSRPHLHAVSRPGGLCATP